MNKFEMAAAEQRIISDYAFDPIQHDGFEQNEDYSILVLMMHMGKVEHVDALIQRHNYFKS